MLISPEDVPQVSQKFMNDTHNEEVDLINTIFEEILAYGSANDNTETIDRLYKEWIEHTVEHFTVEEVEMVEAEFPAFPIHKAEHDNVLLQMNNVFNAWQRTREIKILQMYFMDVVPQWLISHISSMDAMTANYIGGGMTLSHGGMM